MLTKNKQHFQNNKPPKGKKSVYTRKRKKLLRKTQSPELRAKHPYLSFIVTKFSFIISSQVHSTYSIYRTEFDKPKFFIWYTFSSVMEDAGVGTITVYSGGFKRGPTPPPFSEKFLPPL